MRYIFMIYAALFLSSCAPLKELTTIPALADNLNKQVEVAPAFFQNVANEYFKTSEEYKFLTGRSCDGLGTKGIADFYKIPLERKIKDKVITITYADYEQERFAIKSKALQFLTMYATKMRERAEAAEGFSTAVGYVNTGADIATSIPVVGAQAAPYAAATKAIVAALDRFENDYSAIAIVQIAQDTKPQLQKIIDQIKLDYGVINVDAKVYLAAWRECKVAKIKAMRTPLIGLNLPTSAEIDSVYSAYLEQAIAYQKTIPTVDDELDAIVKANTKISVGDFKSVLSATQELVGAANTAYGAIQAVQKLNL